MSKPIYYWSCGMYDCVLVTFGLTKIERDKKNGI